MLSNLLFSVTVLWGAIHTVFWWLWRATHRASLLPNPSSSFARRSPSTTLVYGRTKVFLRGLHVRVQTTAFNAPHDTLSATLRQRKSRRRKHLLQLLYDTGSILGIIGMFLALFLLLWTTAQLGSRIIFQSPNEKDMQNIPQRLMKRIEGPTLSGGLSRARTEKVSGIPLQPLVRLAHTQAIPLEC